MTQPARVDTTPPERVEEKRSFPKCPFCHWRPSMKLFAEGSAVLERLAALAQRLGEPLTRLELSTVISDYKCPKCKSFVPVRVGDLLRN